MQYQSCDFAPVSTFHIRVEQAQIRDEVFFVVSSQHRIGRCGIGDIGIKRRRLHGRSRNREVRFALMDPTTVPKNFKIHDRVSWNSEAGRVSGTITRVHTREFEVKGYTHHASPDDPQYEIKSSKTDHIAFHKGAALTKLGD